MNQIRFMRYRAISRWIVLSFVVCLALSVVGPVPAAAREPSIITFDVPGAGTGAGQGTFPQGIVDRGAIAGYYIDAGGVYHGFLRNPDGWITTFDAPNAGTGTGQGTYVCGMNAQQAITGEYVDAKSVSYGFLRNPDGWITEFSVPGQGEVSFGADINARGTIAGLYYDITIG